MRAVACLAMAYAAAGQLVDDSPWFMSRIKGGDRALQGMAAAVVHARAHRHIDTAPLPPKTVPTPPRVIPLPPPPGWMSHKTVPVVPVAPRFSPASAAGGKADDHLVEFSVSQLFMSPASIAKIAGIGLFATVMAYIAVQAPGNALASPDDYNALFVENLGLVCAALVPTLLLTAALFNDRIHDVDDLVGVVTRGVSVGYLRVVISEVLMCTVVKLALLRFLEPQVVRALRSETPLWVLPWVLREKGIRLKPLSIFSIQLAISCVVAPLLEETAKLTIANAALRKTRKEQQQFHQQQSQQQQGAQRQQQQQQQQSAAQSQSVQLQSVPSQSVQLQSHSVPSQSHSAQPPSAPSQPHPAPPPQHQGQPQAKQEPQQLPLQPQKQATQLQLQPQKQATQLQPQPQKQATQLQPQPQRPQLAPQAHLAQAQAQAQQQAEFDSPERKLLYMIAAGAGLKCADSARRVLLYRPPPNGSSRMFFAVARGFFPVQELCAALTATQLSRRELLDSERSSQRWTAMVPAVLLHAMANFRGMKPLFQWRSGAPWHELQLQVFTSPEESPLAQLLSRGMASFFWFAILARVMVYTARAQAQLKLAYRNRLRRHYNTMVV